MGKKIVYLILDKKQLVPEIAFKIEIEGFSWIKQDETWRYINPMGIFDHEFEVGDQVYDSSCPILGIFDLEDPEHLQRLVNRSYNQQMVTEDLHLYE